MARRQDLLSERHAELLVGEVQQLRETVSHLTSDVSELNGMMGMLHSEAVTPTQREDEQDHVAREPWAQTPGGHDAVFPPGDGPDLLGLFPSERTSQTHAKRGEADAGGRVNRPSRTALRPGSPVLRGRVVLAAAFVWCVALIALGRAPSDVQVSGNGRSFEWVATAQTVRPVRQRLAGPVTMRGVGVRIFRSGVADVEEHSPDWTDVARAERQAEASAAEMAASMRPRVSEAVSLVRATVSRAALQGLVRVESLSDPPLPDPLMLTAYQLQGRSRSPRPAGLVIAFHRDVRWEVSIEAGSVRSPPELARDSRRAALVYPVLRIVENGKRLASVGFDPGSASLTIASDAPGSEALRREYRGEELVVQTLWHLLQEVDAPKREWLSSAS